MKTYNTIKAVPTMSINGFKEGTTYTFHRKDCSKAYEVLNDHGRKFRELDDTLLNSDRSSLLLWKDCPWSSAGRWFVTEKSLTPLEQSKKLINKHSALEFSNSVHYAEFFLHYSEQEFNLTIQGE